MIIAIGHESGVGKDTFAMFMVDHIRAQNIKGLDIKREGFVDRLYNFLHAMYGWAGFKSREHYVMYPKDKEKILEALGKTPRDMLIETSEKLTEMDPSIFYEPVLRDKCHLKLVNDLRRLREFEVCEKRDVYLLAIKKTGFKSMRKMDDELHPHLDRFHRIIYNDGSLKDLQQKAIEFTDEIVMPQIRKILHGEVKL